MLANIPTTKETPQEILKEISLAGKKITSAQLKAELNKIKNKQ